MPWLLPRAFWAVLVRQARRLAPPSRLHLAPTAKAKTTAINLIIVSFYVILSRRDSLRVAEGLYALVADSLGKRVDAVCDPNHAAQLANDLLSCVTVRRRVNLSQEGNVSLLSFNVDRIITYLPSKETTRPDHQFIIGENPS